MRNALVSFKRSRGLSLVVRPGGNRQQDDGSDPEGGIAQSGFFRHAAHSKPENRVCAPAFFTKTRLRSGSGVWRSRPRPRKAPRTCEEEESFDHVLRGDESFREKVEYIQQNPVRRGLVRAAEEYRWLSVEKS